jgi:flagellar biosynthetic protein FlhB
MSDSEAPERTESATPKRLEDARQRGQVPRSPELGTAAVVLTGGAALVGLGDRLVSGMHGIMLSGLQVQREQLGDTDVAVQIFQRSMLEGLMVAAPLLGLIFVAALSAPLVLGGWNFSPDALGFKFERINPMAGFGRMFAVRSFVDLGKAFAKFLFVGLVAILVLYSHRADLALLAREPISAAMGHSVSIAAHSLLSMAGALGVIAAIDVPFQLWSHARALRMTREEVRQEQREAEGSPEIKGRIRSMQNALARRRMMQEVPKASVVITNPTHFAVALRYEDGRTRAPVVVAKGVDDVAARIREIAREHGVPLVSAPPLARVLYRGVEIGREIPSALYVAVAQVLTYVTHLAAARRAGSDAPEAPSIDPSVESALDPGRT